jgi:thymidylate synthase
MTFPSLDDALRSLVAALLTEGEAIAPRKMPTTEIRAVSFSIQDPRRRYVSLEPRHWSLPYAVGEFCWHAAASNRLDAISFYAPRWKQMSDDGTTIRSSCYGARIFGDRNGSGSQWTIARDLLATDPATRRAVLVLAEPLDIQSVMSSDVSCALSLQFLIRDGRLEAIATMRSNDVILGLPYDVFLFTMLQEMMACELQLEVGRYHHFVGSLHLYDRDLETAKGISDSRALISEPMPIMRSLDGLASMLDSERRLRNGEVTDIIQSPTPSYWDDLASVIQYRNARRWDKQQRIDALVNVPLYQSLIKLGTR